MSKKKMNDEYRIELLTAAAIAACNEFIEATFQNKEYDNLHWETKLKVIKVLKTNLKLNARAQA